MRRSFVLLLGLALAGCGSSTDNTSSSLAAPTGVQPIALQSTTASVSRASGAQITVGSHTVTIPPGAISQDSQVTITVEDNGGGLKPANSAEFQVVGQALDLQLGGAEFVGPVSVSLQGSTATNTELYAAIDGVLIPLDNTSTTSNRSTGILGKELTTNNLDIDPADPPKVDPTLHPQHYMVVGVQSIFSRAPHVNWGSYNGYIFQGGSFTKFVSLGNLTGTMPTLGSKPCMIVHGLGSSISGQSFAPLAQYLLDQGIATSVVGFEYDTLDSVVNNGKYLRTFYTLLNPSSGQQWRHVAHSMGTIVSREALEGGSLPVASSNNLVCLACGPHLGTPVVDKLQSSLSLAQRFVKYIVINHILDFTNADGTPCQVSVTDPGFVNLSTTSTVLSALNQNAASNHPQWTYNTMAGTEPGLEYSILDYFMGIYPDDGLVFATSANYSGLGQAQMGVVPDNHSEAVTDPVNAFPIIGGFVR